MDEIITEKTESRETQRTALSHSNNKRVEELENILESIAAPMFVTDADLNITFINDAALEISGYRREDVVGRMRCVELARTPLCGTANCTIKNCMRTRDKIVGETVMKNRDGKEIPIAATCSALFDKDGKPYGGMEVIMDQTEQKDTLKEVARLIDAAKAGKLDERADMGSAKGDYKELREGINEMLDAVIGPLNVAAEYVDRISKGDIPPQITDAYKGDFNEIKNNLNVCIGAINVLVADANMLTEATLEGKLDARADASKHQGDFQNIIKGVNDTLDAVIGPLNMTAEYVDRISKGDIPPAITDTYKGDFNEIKNNLNVCIGAINVLVADADVLSEAAVEGKLDTRADASKHQGDFQKIVKGVNDTLDAVIGPLNVAAEYVDRISKGDIPPAITDTYKGEFNEIKNNLNVCIGAINALVADADVLSEAAVEGKLDTRADASKHQGDFQKIVKGVNETLDAVIGPLNMTAEYVDRISKGDIPPQITDAYKGDFNKSFRV